MTPIEVLNEIQKLPLEDVRQVAKQLEDYLREQEKATQMSEETEQRENEFERKLLAEGFISHIPTRDETDEEFDAFEPIEIEGEPLSEIIIRERH